MDSGQQGSLSRLLSSFDGGTAALLYSDISFVDFDSKVELLYSDPLVKEYVETNKVYDADPHYKFYCNLCDNHSRTIDSTMDSTCSFLKSHS